VSIGVRQAHEAQQHHGTGSEYGRRACNCLTQELETLFLRVEFALELDVAVEVKAHTNDPGANEDHHQDLHDLHSETVR
jgi:hypothetical protein